MYITSKPQETLDYFQELKDLGNYEKHEAIIKDMHDLSEIVDFKIHL
jgi:hypothetical protein